MRMPACPGVIVMRYWNDPMPRAPALALLGIAGSEQIRMCAKRDMGAAMFFESPDMLTVLEVKWE